MSFVVLICAELLQERVNLEFPFESRPSIAELVEIVERVFRFEASNLLQQQSQPLEPIFTVQKLLIYDDEARQWVELTHPSQLHMYDQLFVIRKYINPESSRRGEPPRPRTSQYFGGKAVPVSASASTPPAGATTTSLGAQAAQSQQPRDRNRQASPSGGSAVVSFDPNVAFASSSSVTNTAAAAANSHNNNNNSNTMLMTPSRTSSVLAAGSSSYPITTGGGRPSASAVPGSSATLHGLSQAILDGNVTAAEIQRVVFEAIDRKRQGVINFHDLSSLFRVLSIQVDNKSIEEMFAQYAQSGVGGRSGDYQTSSVMSFRDFQNLAVAYETTVNTMFHRIISIEKEARISDALQDTATKVAHMVKQRQELEDTIKRLDQDIQREGSRRHALEEELDELLKDRNADIMEDQVVVDKEVKVQHQRYVLKLEEEDYAAQLAERGRRRQASGSMGVYGDAAGGRSLSNQSSVSATPRHTFRLH